MSIDKKTQRSWYQNWWVWGIVIILCANIGLFFISYHNGSTQRIKSPSSEQQKQITANQESLEALVRNPDLLYINELENHTKKWADLFSDLNRVLQSTESNSEEWEENIYEVLFYMQALIEESEIMSPSENLSYIHKEYLAAIQHFEKMVTDLPNAVHRQDIDTIESCLEELRKGVTYLQKTRDMISAYADQSNEDSEN
jgi:hypothetical protein